MQQNGALSVTTGARCYIPDADAAWLPVYVEDVNVATKLVTVRIQRLRQDRPTDHDENDRSGELRIVAMQTGFPLQNAQLSRHDKGLANMIELTHLHEAAILRNLKKRLGARLPYTYTGDICLAVNPYQWLDELYTPGLHQKYLLARSRQDLPPHVYAVSVAAFKHMCEHGTNQSILVSGESGAGKTETTKILMDNLAIIASSPKATNSTGNLTTRVLQVTPLLESFGNAKTTRNDNSSRFGKLTQLQFDTQHALCGAQCETYLLEKTRVISQERGERNYHIFYQLLHGTTEEECNAMGLGRNAPNFAYLEAKGPQRDTRPKRKPTDNHSSVSPPPGMMETEIANDRARFVKTRQALSLLGLTAEQQTGLFYVLAGILHLGEAQFIAKPANNEACELVPASVRYSSRLLGLTPESMATALTQRTMNAAGDVYLVPLTVAQAYAGRDALAKTIYASIFDWLVAGINANLGAALRLSRCTIGVLDIFGFESFEHNSFEQLCINYANEKLQQKFIQDVFRAGQEEYAREKITWAHIAYADNSETLALIEGRMGVLALLTEEIVRPCGNEEGFVRKLSRAYAKQTQLVEFPRTWKTRFAIHHYAGTVLYEATGFLQKHKDSLGADLSTLMRGSHDPFPQMLFTANAENQAAEGKRGSSSGRKCGGNNGPDKTVGMQFKHSLTALMTTIRDTNVNYIRCIKPNSIKSSTLLEDKMVANQLRCAGVIEAICIARVGYPTRLLHGDFAAHFDLFLTRQEQVQLHQAPKTCGTRYCGHLVRHAFQLETPKEYQLGVTKIYLQKGVLEKLERIKAEALFAYVAKIQAQWRGMVARCQYHFHCAALLLIQRRARVLVTQTRFRRAKVALAVIQRMWRGYIGRCVFHVTLCEHCCRAIQRVWRGYNGRKTFFAFLGHNRAVKIQRTWRGHNGRHIGAARLRQIRAVQLQCWVRQYVARQDLARRRVAYVANVQQERVAHERKVAKREQERKPQAQVATDAVKLRPTNITRKRTALAMRVRRERAVIVLQRMTRGQLTRKQLQARQHAATRVQQITRKFLARQRVDAIEDTRRHPAAKDAATRRQRKGTLAGTLRPNEQRTRWMAKDQELARVMEENARLKHELAELHVQHRALAAAVADSRCTCHVVNASPLPRARDASCSALCDVFEPSGSSRRSTEPEEELTLSDSASDRSSHYGDEETQNWAADRPSITSLAASLYGRDQPPQDIVKLLSRSQARLANAMHDRRDHARQVANQRKQQATAAVQHGTDWQARRRATGVASSLRGKKWPTFPRFKRGKTRATRSPVDPGEERGE